MGGPGSLSEAGKKLLGTAVSACPKPEDNVVADGANFTEGDLHGLLSEYYGYNINEHIEPAQDTARDGVLTSLFMNAIPGALCVKDLGPRANRLLADRIDDTCKDEVLTGAGGDEKCEALYRVVDARAEESTGQKISRYLGWGSVSIGTLFGTWAIFGPGMSVWRMMETGGYSFVEAIKAVQGARVVAAATRVAITAEIVAQQAAAAGRTAVDAVKSSGGAAVGGTTAAAAAAGEAGAAAMPFIGPIGAFAGGLAFGHFVVNKGGAYLAGAKTHDGEASLSAWYADEVANLTPRSAQLMIHDIAAWF